MTFWSVFFGVFTGIFVGVQTNLIIEAIKIKRINKKRIKNLKYEFKYNINKINQEFLKDADDYLNHINGNSPQSYFGKIHLTGLLKTTLNQIFSDGSIYKYFDYENIGKLQRLITDFTPQDEERINTFIENISKIDNIEKVRKVANELVTEYLKEGIEAGKNNLLTIKFKNKKKVFEGS